ncbi:S8 family peptidase [Gorillibacterium sp. CAU 1737]|uniref:S8 family peptidase n=1 Tax=Gorillibacterium sp. CAU 1737 TaxID=3140362 RepID=UPI003260C07B
MKRVEEESPISTKTKRKVHSTAHLIVKYRNGVSRASVASACHKNGDRLVSCNAKLGFDIIEVKGNLSRALHRYKKQAGVEYVEPNYVRRAAYIPNDPLYSQQYGPAAIQAPKAWDRTLGKKKIIIAVLDTGVQTSHPDLKTKLISGYNFVGNNTNTADDNGHGTHVAGIAAAATGNRTGIAGMAPRCQILPVKILDAAGNGTIHQIVQGIHYAVDRGAHVINMSFAGSDNSKLEADAIRYAKKKGVALIAAAGNDNTTTRCYPAAFADVLAVGAIDRSGKRASFSNYGKWVGVTAPGVDILSTYPPGRYQQMSGTSMAAPHVSGLAGLLASQGLSGTKIHSRIQKTADQIGGTGSLWKYGRVNAAKAVRGTAIRSSGQVFAARRRSRRAAVLLLTTGP